MLRFAQFLIKTQSRKNVAESVDPDEADMKGWMSPKGSAHHFPANDVHGWNPHPEIEDAVTTHMDKHFSAADADPDEAERALAIHQQRLGYARFGRSRGENYIHFDHKSKGGAQAALHALNHLDPSNYDSRIHIEHKPWTKHNNDPGRHFDSRSAAAAHIRRFIGKQ